MELLWLPFSMATLVMYGLGQVFAKESRTNVPSANLLLILSVNIFVIWSVYWILFREPGTHSAEAWIEGIVAAALSGAAYVTYYESLKHGKVSIVGTIAGAYAPWTVFLAFVFLGEKMSFGEAAGVVLVVAAMLIFTLVRNGEGNGSRKTELISIVFAILSLFFWGTSAATAKGAIDQIGNTNFVGIYAIVCPAMWTVYWITSTRAKFEMPKTNRWILQVSMLFLTLGGITYYLAIQNGNVSIVTPVTNLYPVLTIAVAKVRLRESLTRNQIIALGMLIVSIPLFSL